MEFRSRYNSSRFNTSRFALEGFRLGAVGEIVTSITIEALTFVPGDPSTLEIEVTYTEEAPLTVYAVTGTDPIMLGLTDGEKRAILKAGSGGTNTIEFFNFGVTAPNDIDDITGLTAASNAADRILLYIEDGDGVQSDIAEVTVSGLSFPGAFEVSNIGQDFYTDLASTTWDTTLDLSGYSAGDQIILAYGIDHGSVSSITLNGTSMGAAAYSDVGNANRTKIQAWVYTLPSDGTASDALSVVSTSSTSRLQYDLWGVKGGTVDDGSALGFFEGGYTPPAERSVTPTAATNVILGIYLGDEANTSVTWTNATEQLDLKHPTKSRLISNAIAENVPVAPYTVGVTPDGSGERGGMVVLAISEA